MNYSPEAVADSPDGTERSFVDGMATMSSPKMTVQSVQRVYVEFVGGGLGFVGDSGIFQPIHPTSLHAVQGSIAMYSLTLAIAIILAGIALGRSVLHWLGYRVGGADEAIALGGGLASSNLRKMNDAMSSVWWVAR